MRKFWKFLKGLIGLAASLLVVCGLFVIFMWVTTGSIKLDNFISEVNSDYRDLDLKRPQKDTEFTRMINNASRQREKQVANDKNSKQLSDAEYNKILVTYAEGMNKHLISLPDKDKAKKSLFTINFKDKAKVKEHKQVIKKSLEDVKKDYENYTNSIKGKQIPAKYIEIDGLIKEANKDFDKGLSTFIVGLESKDNVIVYKGIQNVYSGKEKMDKVSEELKENKK